MDSEKPKKVGEGTYGCVFKPSLKCRNKNVNYKNKISKVMLLKNAKNELEEYNSIKNIKGLDKYAITSPEFCLPQQISDFFNGVQNCSKEEIYLNAKKQQEELTNKVPHKDRLAMLIYEDGGINLYNFMTEIFNKIDLEQQKIFFTSLLNLIDGLSFFNENNIVHRDIKSLNIVYNIQTGKAKYIDFGLMIKKDKLIDNCMKNKEDLALSWPYFPPENSCSLYSIFMNVYKCKKYRSNFEYSTFIKNITNTFDLYSLSLVLLDIAKFLKKKGLNKKIVALGNNLSLLFAPFSKKDLLSRNQNINELRKSYYNFLIKSNLYSKSSPSPKPNMVKLVKQISKDEIALESKKKSCVDPKPIFNPISGRCLALCKDGFIRNEVFKCVKNKTKKNSKPKSIQENSTTKKELCIKQDKDYNHITRRCNKRCPPNKTRDSKFKCVSIK